MCCFEDNEDYVIEKISINLPRNMVSPTVGSEGYADAVANDIEYITECLVWESSNEDVITVTQDGKLTAVGGGTAVISVYSRRNPSVYGYATITVEEEEVEVSRITLSCSTSTTLSVGDKGTATATVYPSNATDKTVTFRSTNTSVMSCTSGGNYTARTPGTASIVATASNEVTASKTFTVKVEPTGIIVDSHCICLRPGCEYYLNASVIPSTAPRGIRYTSMNDSIADVGSDGRICAHHYGQTRIKVMASSKTSVYTYVTVYVSDCGCNCDDCEDTVCASSVIFTDTPKRQIFVGETGYITSYVCPSNAVNKTVTYSSNNRSVLSCASNGYYEAKAVGSATVTARTSNGVIATKTYTVKDVPAGINVERTCVCLSPGCEYYLNASVIPSTAPQGIEYESMNEGIVKVGSDGRICALDYGQTLIKVMSSSKASVYTYVTVCVSDCGCDCDDCVDENDNVIIAKETHTDAYEVQEDEFASTHQIGPNATGIVDLRNGRLKFSITDFAWDGLIAPVTIKHLYTSALKDSFFSAGCVEELSIKDYSEMKTGYGWRLNYMCSLEKGSEVIDGQSVKVYTFVERNGGIHKLYPTADANVFEDRAGAGAVMEILDNKWYVTIGTDYYWCEEDGGYVWRVYDTTTADARADQASVEMTYSTGQRVSKVKDGSKREFAMTYKSSRLSKMTAPDGTQIAYKYNNELLTKITYPRGESLNFVYDSENHITSVSLMNFDGECEYTIEYSYFGDVVTEVTEYGKNGTRGRAMTYEYGGDCTKVITKEYSDNNSVENTTVNTFVFDNKGELINSYTEHNGYMQSNGMEDNFGAVDTGATHSYERSSLNLLLGHGFEDTADLEQWYVAMGGTAEVPNPEEHKHLSHDGKGCLHLVAEGNGAGSTLHQSQYLPAGEYVFSAYVKAVSATEAEGGAQPGIYLTVYGADGSGANSVKVSDTGNGYLRLFATFTSSVEQNVTAVISIEGDGEYYVDSAQLEQGSAPSAYNAVENGAFRHSDLSWNHDGDSNGCVCYEDTMDVFSGHMTAQLENDYIHMPYQEVKVKSFKNTRTTYTLSGFAKLDSVADESNENLNFRLRACIRYVKGESSGEEPWCYEQYCADFSKATDEWQYASVTFAKAQFRTIEAIEVTCEYFDRTLSNSGTTYAHFDTVSLTVGETEYDLTEEDFASYNSHEDDENIYEAEEDTTAGFEEVMARYNIPLTETTYSDESLHTIYRSQLPCSDFTAYSKTFDSRGNATVYTTDENTSRVTEVTDREGNVTTYGYDEAGNVTQICEYDEASDAMVGVNLTYDAFNELESVTRSDGMTYNYGYNEFHRLESVGIDGRTAPLVQYAYKNRNGSLKNITYANGDSADITYDRFGRPVREIWKNSAGTVTQDTKYSYDGNGNPVSVLDITNETEYTYVYENGRIVCEMQSEGAYISSNGYKYAGTLVCKTIYRYNADGRIAEKIVSDSSGELLEKYTYTDKGEATVTLSSGAKVRSRNDALGRVAFDEIQTGENAVFRKFEYHDGAISEVHEMCGGMYSAPTTELVERISYSDGDELAYTYDKEERITSVVGKYTNLYEYDSHGQLTMETYTDSDGDTTVTEVEYDKAGNILSKGGKTYRYRDGTWFDQLTEYDGQAIRYDASGNPTTYLGGTMTWTAGRKLSSYVDDTNEVYYTYNSLGQRTQKTVNGKTHTYIYEGHRLVKEIITDTDGTVNTLVFLYDSSDSPVGMQYNGTAYYYKKNLQGDVIGLLNVSGETIAEYIYDAWGALREPVDANSIAEINPIRYRGYYYDNETGFYFLQSRYYNPVVGRFINADETLFLGVSGTALGYNLYAYCENDAVNHSDPLGFLLLATAGASTLIASTTAVGGANAWNPLGWILLGVAAIATVALIAYTLNKDCTRILSTVKPKTTREHVFKLAYIDSSGNLQKVGKAMTFVEALSILGVKKAACSLTRRYTISALRPELCLTKYWGVYSTNQAYASALAIMLECLALPEVHGSGKYGHYHDLQHIIHIWYGYPIVYK